MSQLTTWFTLGTAGMVLGTLALAYGLTRLPQEHRRRFALVVAVPGIATVAYGLMALGIGEVTSLDGSALFVPRYVDWLLTTPLNVVYVALLVGAGSRMLGRLSVLQALTIVFGAVGAFLTPPLKFAFFALGAVSFAAVVYTLYRDLDPRSDCQNDTSRSQFRKLRAFVVVLWLVYPAIWLVGPAGFELMDVETAALVIAYIDVVAKVGFGLIALNDLLTAEATSDVAAAEATAD